MVYWTISAKTYFCPAGRYLFLPWQKPVSSRNCQTWKICINTPSHLRFDQSHFWCYTRASSWTTTVWSLHIPSSHYSMASWHHLQNWMHASLKLDHGLAAASWKSMIIKRMCSSILLSQFSQNLRVMFGQTQNRKQYITHVCKSSFIQPWSIRCLTENCGTCIHCIEDRVPGRCVNQLQNIQNCTACLVTVIHKYNHI